MYDNSLIADVLDNTAALLHAAAATVRRTVRETSAMRDRLDDMQQEIELLQGYRENARPEDPRTIAELLRDDHVPGSPQPEPPAPVVDLMSTAWGKLLAAPGPAPAASPAADIPPLDAVAAPSPAVRTRRGRGRKNDGDGEGQTPAPAPDAATDGEAREQVAQVLGDAPVAVPRDVTADLFGAAPGAAPAPTAATDDDFPPL